MVSLEKESVELNGRSQGMIIRELFIYLPAEDDVDDDGCCLRQTTCLPSHPVS